MSYTLTIEPGGRLLNVSEGVNLLEALRRQGLSVDSPCGGQGKCHKCQVQIDGQPQFACQTAVMRDMVVTLPDRDESAILLTGPDENRSVTPGIEGFLLALDIGTTSVVCYLLDGRSGQELACTSMLNPQRSYGADVISRIHACLNGEDRTMAQLIRGGVTQLIADACHQTGANPREIRVVSIVGNPAMQQMFLHLPVDNLSTIPFDPVLTQAGTMPTREILPICPDAELLLVPDISGYVGADTMGCILSTRLYDSDLLTLMVDIGTNGEMVLGNHERMLACSTAAGPALEGANITHGMRGAVGAIDHVWQDSEGIGYSEIGGSKAKGICGSGLVDAVAVLLETKQINSRGRIQIEQKIDGQRIIPITDEVYLTQDDIRNVQLAKGAIAAGIELMCSQYGIAVDRIDRVLLAGAFGSYLDPLMACRIGLLPSVLSDRISAVGNAAGSGAKILARDKNMLKATQELCQRIKFLELASLPGFQRCFAKNMRLNDGT